MFASRSSVARRIAAVTVAALFVLVGAASAAPAPPPAFVDSVVGAGSTPIFEHFDVNVVSGPSGENPTGTETVTFAGTVFTLTSVSCLAVTGNQATVVGPLATNSYGFTFGKATYVDNGSPGTGLDTMGAGGFTGTTAPDCSPPFFGDLLTSGDITVRDGSPPPTSKDQCKNGGWATVGFSNQGQCVAYVQRGPKP
jgi:hypothetical protein